MPGEAQQIADVPGCSRCSLLTPAGAGGQGVARVGGRPWRRAGWRAGVSPDDMNARNRARCDAAADGWSVRRPSWHQRRRGPRRWCWGGPDGRPGPASIPRLLEASIRSRSAGTARPPRPEAGRQHPRQFVGRVRFEAWTRRALRVGRRAARSPPQCAARSSPHVGDWRPSDSAQSCQLGCRTLVLPSA